MDKIKKMLANIFISRKFQIEYFAKETNTTFQKETQKETRQRQDNERSKHNHFSSLNFVKNNDTLKKIIPKTLDFKNKIILSYFIFERANSTKCNRF